VVEEEEEEEGGLGGCRLGKPSLGFPEFDIDKKLQYEPNNCKFHPQKVQCVTVLLSFKSAIDCRFLDK
jgi:hypothetical protein